MENKPERKELFFGLVGPVGTDLDSVITSLKNSLHSGNYDSETIRFSHLLHELEGLSTDLNTSLPEDDRITNHMNAGDELRRTVQYGGALASLTMIQISIERKKKTGNANQPATSFAYILNSLKHPHEVEILRNVYGKSFWLISAYSPKDNRQERLAKKISDSRHESSSENYYPSALKLMSRDQEDTGDKFGQNVRAIFPLGDVFIDTRDSQVLEKSINRFVQLIFDDPYPTPNIEEYGMFYAQSSALRSGSLARQVGAAITTAQGDILATGTNEVPKFGGGLCGADDIPDLRESAKGYDSNTKTKIDLLYDFVSRLIKEGWLSEEQKKKNPEDLVKEILDSSVLSESNLMNVTEFGREVHAEMAALTDAARRTISADQGILYCTTFPCHVCTKHIISAGIRKVIYIEPYPKSLAEELFGDFITVDKQKEDKKIEFKPFVGISPRRFMDLFSFQEKKQKDGKKIEWNIEVAIPRFSEDPYAIIKLENEEVLKIKEKISSTKIKLRK